MLVYVALANLRNIRQDFDAYGKGGFAFADMSHRGSILCLPSGIHGWDPSDPAALTIEDTDLPKTINFNFEYLRSGRPEDTYANVFMVKQGQRVAHLRVEAWQSSPDKPIATGHGNFMLKGTPSTEGNS